MDLTHAYAATTNFILREVNGRNCRGVVLGLSGGLDSSVAATLAVKALGPSRVLGLVLPDKASLSDTGAIDGAVRLANNLGMKYNLIDVGRARSDLTKQLPSNKLARGNLTVRLRMCVLYYYAAIRKLLVVGTSDRSELELGYFTKYGDGAADILPIGGLYKTEVRELGRHIGLPNRILKKKSTPGLWRGQTAESEIGLNYEEVDQILRNIHGNESHPQQISSKKVALVKLLVEKNKHKQTLPPVCKL
jgi:NAD+ synthase